MSVAEPVNGLIREPPQVTRRRGPRDTLKNLVAVFVFKKKGLLPPRGSAEEYPSK